MPPEALAESAPLAEEPPRFTFSLATLMLIVTLLAVVFGLLAVHPCLGVLVGILAVPASIRVGQMAARRHAWGRRMTGDERLLAFADSLVTVAGIGLPSVLAFFTVCVPVGLAMLEFSYSAVWTWLACSVGGGLLAGGTMLWVLGRSMWPWED